MATGELRRNDGLVAKFVMLVSAAKMLLSLGGMFGIGSELMQLAQEILAVEEPWTTASGVKLRLALFFRVGKIYTSRTPSPDDDALLAKVEGLVTSDAAAELLASLISRFKASGAPATPEAFQAFVMQPEIEDSIREAAVEKQLDFATIMELIQLIIKVIGMLKGTGTTATETGGSNPWNF